MKTAGILLYRTDPVRVYLGHPGSPFYKRKDRGVWTIPKGHIEQDESMEEAARREFDEETGLRPEGELIPLGEVRFGSGKRLFGFACRYDGPDFALDSDTQKVKTSRGVVRAPELDRAEWFPLATAKRKIHPVQKPFLDRLTADVL